MHSQLFESRFLGPLEKTRTLGMTQLRSVSTEEKRWCPRLACRNRSVSPPLPDVGRPKIKMED